MKRQTVLTIILFILTVGLFLSSCSKMDNVSEESEELKVAGYDFSGFKNVEITGIDLTSLDENQLSVLYVQARYCQAISTGWAAFLWKMWLQRWAD